MKNSQNILTLAASLATATFIALLAFGLVSLTAFLVSASAWLIISAVAAYTPRHRVIRMPKNPSAQVAFPIATRRAALPLAA